MIYGLGNANHAPTVTLIPIIIQDSNPNLEFLDSDDFGVHPSHTKGMYFYPLV